MHLIIDAGNTRIKWACLPTFAPLPELSAFKANACFTQTWLNADIATQQSSALASAVLQAEQVWVSNVAGELCWQALCHLPSRAKFHRIHAQAEYLGLHNHYMPPAQLGVDRWLTSMAVWHYVGQSALVVSAGTAFTIDAIQVHAMASNAKQAHFLGGTIQPGLALMWQSLQQGTAQLSMPMSTIPTSQSHAEHASSARRIGFAQQTEDAMLQGCQLAMLGAVRLQYHTLSALTQQATQSLPYLVLTGGDAAWLASCLRETSTPLSGAEAVSISPAIQAIDTQKITYIPDLVLHGLAIAAQKSTT